VANTQVTIASRKIGGTWEAVLLTDGKFMRAFQGQVGQSLGGVVGGIVAEYISINRNEGTEIALNLSISEPDAV
jgi:hypothetical protein